MGKPCRCMQFIKKKQTYFSLRVTRKFVQKKHHISSIRPPPPILSVFRCLGTFLINFSTTNENPSCHRNLAARYQLVQTVLKTGSMLAERMGQGEVTLRATVHCSCGSWLVSIVWDIFLLSCTKRSFKHL